MSRLLSRGLPSLARCCISGGGVEGSGVSEVSFGGLSFLVCVVLVVFILTFTFTL